MIKRQSRFIEEPDPPSTTKWTPHPAMSNDFSKKPLVPDPRDGPRVEKDSDVRRRDQLYLLQDLCMKNSAPPTIKAPPKRRRPRLLGSKKKRHDESQKAGEGRLPYKPVEFSKNMDPDNVFGLKNTSRYDLYTGIQPPVLCPSSAKGKYPNCNRPETPPPEPLENIKDHLPKISMSPLKVPDLSNREIFKYSSKDISPKKMPNKYEEPLKTTMQTNSFFRKLSGRQHRLSPKKGRVGIRSSVVSFRKSVSTNTELSKVDEIYAAAAITSSENPPRHPIQETEPTINNSPERLVAAEYLANQASPCSTISARVESARSAIAAKASHVDILSTATTSKLYFPSPPPTAALPHPPISQTSPVREHKKSGSFGYHPFPKTSPRGSPQKSPAKKIKHVRDTSIQASAGAIMAKSGSAPLLSRTYTPPEPGIRRKPSLEPSPMPDSPLMSAKKPPRFDETVDRQQRAEVKKRRDMAHHRAWIANGDDQAAGTRQGEEVHERERRLVTKEETKEPTNKWKEDDEVVHLPSIRDSYESAPYITAYGVNGYHIERATPEPLRVEKPPTPPKQAQSMRKSRIVVLADQVPQAVFATQLPNDLDAYIHPLHRQAAGQRRVSPLNPLAPSFIANHKPEKHYDIPNGHASPRPAIGASHPLRREFSTRSAHSLPNDPRDYSPRNSLNSLVAESLEVRLSAVERKSFLLERALVAVLEASAVLEGRIPYGNGNNGPEDRASMRKGSNGMHAEDANDEEDIVKAYL